MKRFLFLAIIVCLLTACGKNGNFPSTPQITFKSINPAEMHRSDSLTIICGFKDAEGDLQDSVFFRQHSTGYDGVFGGYPVPSFPPQHNLQGNVILFLKSGIHVVFPVNPGVADSTYFDIYLKDKAGNISDTIQTTKIALITD